MIFFRRWLPILISLSLVYFLAYLHDYDFGFAEKTNFFIVESLHFFIFGLFGFLIYAVMCDGKTRRVCTIYAFAVIFFTSVAGIINEARIHPHEGVFRDMVMHISSGIFGMIAWKLVSVTKLDEI